MQAKQHLTNIVRVDVPDVDRLTKVRLDRNERSSCWPDQLWCQIQEVISPELIMSYPELGSVYEKLAQALGVNRSQLLLSHGSDVGLKGIFEVYAGSGDEVISLVPSYAMYPLYAQMVAAQPVEVRFLQDLSLPFDLILNAVSARTRMVILANPNQPIERIFNTNELETILELALKKDFLLVIDEAYYYFHPQTAISYIDKNPNLIVTRSFSKAFGMAGLRAGLLISNANIISEIRKVKAISEINAVAARLIEFFLDKIEIVQAYVREVALSRQLVMERAGKLGIPTYGTSGNSILLELKNAEQVKQIVAEARKQGYLLKGPFPKPAQRHLRITLDSQGIIDKAMDIIERSLDD